MNSRNFEQASWLVARARGIEAEESLIAAQNLAQAHRNAGERVRRRFEAERKAVIDEFEMRISALGAKEAGERSSIENRLGKWRKVAADAELAKRNAPRPVPAHDKQPMIPKLLPVNMTGKLRLPDLKTRPCMKKNTAGRL
jgi:hypothetical protein